MILHVYKHHTTSYFSDTGGYWVAIDEAGKYRGRMSELRRWSIAFQARLHHGTHPDRCPTEIVAIKAYTEPVDAAYSIYWLEADATSQYRNPRNTLTTT